MIWRLDLLSGWGKVAGCVARSTALAMNLCAASTLGYAEGAADATSPTPLADSGPNILSKDSDHARVPTLASNSLGIYFTLEYVGSGNPGASAIIRVRSASTDNLQDPPGVDLVDEIPLGLLANQKEVATAPIIANFSDFLLVNASQSDRVRIGSAHRLTRFGLSDRAPTAGMTAIAELRQLRSSADDEVSALLEASTSVAALRIGGTEEPPYCSGFLAVSTDTVLTAGHCVEMSGEFTRTASTSRPSCGDIMILFGFFGRDSRFDAVRCDKVEFYRGSLEAPGDFALLKLARPLAREPLTLQKMPLRAAANGSILHHPAGREMRVSRDCVVEPGPNDTILHRCPTLGASSGAPILSMTSQSGSPPHLEVLGIHLGDDGRFRGELRRVADQIAERCRAPISTNCILDFVIEGFTALSAESWRNRGVAASAVRRNLEASRSK